MGILHYYDHMKTYVRAFTSPSEKRQTSLFVWRSSAGEAKAVPAFTLLELLVVIAIIGLISAIVVAILTQARADSRDSKRLADIKEIQKALELYYDEASGYPATLNELVPEYLTASAQDPAGTPYYYDQTSGGASYHIGANLEKTNHDALLGDKDSVSDTINGADSADCGGGTISGRRCYDIVP